MIEQMGYQAITAIDGMDALKQLHEHNISLILTDLEMPRMNGLELTQAVRIWPEMRHIPIIMITSRSTQKHKNMADTAGIDEYLTKPVDRLTLENHVAKWLSAELAA
jgi:chemosensory pili system protein ChpA (sensor histidine kinase/response regulator)